MKKMAISLISIVALSMVIMAIAPVIAKPGVVNVTVTVKDSSGNFVSGYLVCIHVDGDIYKYTEELLTNRRGKVTIAVPSEWSDPNSELVRGNWGGSVWYTSGTVAFTDKPTLKVLATYTGP